jgi:hypothetical protein
MCVGARPAGADDRAAVLRTRGCSADSRLALDDPVPSEGGGAQAAAAPSPTQAATGVDDATNLHVLFGATWANQDISSAIEVSFERRLSDYFSLEGAYINEGHFQDHHRDSVAIQLFAQRRVLNDRIRLRVGVGPQLYFDTRSANNPEGSTDAHGIGLLGTMGAELELAHGLFLEARGNGALDQNDFASAQALFGLGYHLGPPDPRDTGPDQHKYMMFVLGGQSIRNSFASERGAAVMAGLEREQILGVVGVRASYLRLGSLNDRQGLATELSAVERFFEQRLRLAATLGSFLYGDTTSDGRKQFGVAGLVGAHAGWRVFPDLDVLVSAMREFGNQDYDLLLAGLGGRF